MRQPRTQTSHTHSPLRLRLLEKSRPRTELVYSENLGCLIPAARHFGIEVIDQILVRQRYLKSGLRLVAGIGHVAR